MNMNFDAPQQCIVRELVRRHKQYVLRFTVNCCIRRAESNLEPAQARIERVADQSG
jgi:hypothetical protein